MSAFVLFVIFPLSITTAYDIQLVVTKDAVENILDTYIPLLTRSAHFESYSNGLTQEGAYVSWENMLLTNFSYGGYNITLNPKSQSFRLTVNDIQLHSNVFDIAVRYGFIGCKGEAQIFMNKWNISVEFHINDSLYNQQGEIPNAKDFDVTGCQLQVNLVNESLNIISSSDNPFPFAFTFTDYLCDSSANADSTQAKFTDYLKDFLYDDLPSAVDEILSGTLDDLQYESQELHLNVGSASETFVICYQNVTILTDESVLIAADVIGNLSDSEYTYSSNPSLFDDFGIGETPGPGPIVLEVLIIIITSIFTLIGVYCSVINRCYYQQICNKCKKKDAKKHSFGANDEMDYNPPLMSTDDGLDRDAL